jgi:hypothetical protein
LSVIPGDNTEVRRWSTYEQGESRRGEGSKEMDRCPLTQALIDYGATGCFIDIEWAKLNNVPRLPLTNPIPVYNVDGTANDAGAITDIANVILRYENHSECTQLAVTRLGKQSLILGYNWLQNHNPEINWQTKDVKMSRCCKGTSVCSLTSPILSHFLPVHMYSLSSPWYYLQGPYL